MLRDHRLSDYLRGLDSAGAEGAACGYLKEFDLLTAAPGLRAGLRPEQLFPTGAVRSVRAWIGPAKATTGLHYDLLDNLAVQVLGIKQWRVVAPGTVERLGGLSDKYDAWAVLAQQSAQTLAALAGSGNEEFFEAELRPGDVLHIPAGWWHEASNVTPSLLFGGFHGSVARVLPRWVGVTVRQLAHQAGWWGAGNCTCHVAR
jgi:lysine-specific demethylase 8